MELKPLEAFLADVKLVAAAFKGLKFYPLGTFLNKGNTRVLLHTSMRFSGTESTTNFLRCLQSK